MVIKPYLSHSGSLAEAAFEKAGELNGQAILKKNVCLQLPTQGLKEWVGGSDFFFFFFAMWKNTLP